MSPPTDFMRIVMSDVRFSIVRQSDTWYKRSEYNHPVRTAHM